LLLLVTTVVLAVSCTDVEGAKETLLDSGYHPIEVGGHGWFQGGEGDVYCTKFKAYSPDSTRIVKGVVTKGLLKGSTVRLD